MLTDFCHRHNTASGCRDEVTSWLTSARLVTRCFVRSGLGVLEPKCRLGGSFRAPWTARLTSADAMKQVVQPAARMVFLGLARRHEEVQRKEIVVEALICWGLDHRGVTEHDGTLFVLCFSDDGPDTGPHPISSEELRAAFDPSNGWNVAAIEPDRIQTRYHDDGGLAWFATIKRI